MRAKPLHRRVFMQQRRMLAAAGQQHTGGAAGRPREAVSVRRRRRRNVRFQPVSGNAKPSNGQPTPDGRRSGFPRLDRRVAH